MAPRQLIDTTLILQEVQKTTSPDPNYDWSWGVEIDDYYDNRGRYEGIEDYDDFDLYEEDNYHLYTCVEERDIDRIQDMMDTWDELVGLDDYDDWEEPYVDMFFQTAREMKTRGYRIRNRRRMRYLPPKHASWKAFRGSQYQPVD